MSRPLRIGTNFTLPLEWMTLATVVYGARGSGKTSLGAVFAEELTGAAQRFCAVDLKGDYFGLKSSADGKQPGIPAVVFGGDHQDVPLEDGAGVFVGETVATLGQSCILDLEHLSKGKQIRFLAAFFESLYHHNRDPLLLLLDEAQRYAPQRPMDPDAARCLGATEDLVKLGRKHGIGPVLFTQRGSGLNKEVSELCDVLVAFRTPGPLDQDRIKDWLDANTTKEHRVEVMGKLAGLPTGTAVFASGHPDLKIFGTYQVRRRTTFDSSATPKVGQRRIEPRMLAKPDLEVLKGKMAAAIERQKADDPKALRAELAALKAELAKVKAAPAPAPKQQRVEVPMLSEKHVKRLEAAIARAASLHSRALEAFTPIVEAFRGAELAMRAALRVPTATLVAGSVRPAPATTSPTPPTPARVMAGPGDDAVGHGGLRRILVALAQRPQGLTLRQIGIRATLASRGGTFSTYMSRARQSGWIHDAGGGLTTITEAGLVALGSYEPLPTGQALLEHWLRDLGGSGAARILRAVADVYPKGLTLEQLGERTTMAARGGTFSTYLSRLRTLQLIEGRGEVRAAAELFA